MTTLQCHLGLLLLAATVLPACSSTDAIGALDTAVDADGLWDDVGAEDTLENWIRERELQQRLENGESPQGNGGLPAGFPGPGNTASESAEPIEWNLTIRATRLHKTLLDAIGRLSRGDTESAGLMFAEVQQVLRESFGQGASRKSRQAMSKTLVGTEYTLARILRGVSEILRRGPDVRNLIRQDDVAWGPGRPVALGPYLLGILLEDDMKSHEARRAYTEAARQARHVEALEEALQRIDSGVYTEPGYGVVHVIHLSGRGPFLATTRSMSSGQADSGVADDGPKLQLIIPTPDPHRLSIAAEGHDELITQPLADMNSLAGTRAARAEGKLEAPETNLPLGWDAMPAQIGVARLELPAGEQTLALDGEHEVRLRVRKGYASFVLVIQPDPSLAPDVVVDSSSRVAPTPVASQRRGKGRLQTVAARQSR